MTHVRQQIRSQVEADLTGLTTTGANVFASRVHQLNVSPGLLIYTQSEESERDTMSGGIFRTVSVSVEGYALDADATDDTLDTICAEVETALLDGSNVGGLAKDIQLVSTEVSFEQGGELLLGRIIMIFDIFYVTDQGAPEVAL